MLHPLAVFACQEEIREVEQEAYRIHEMRKNLGIVEKKMDDAALLQQVNQLKVTYIRLRGAGMPRMDTG